jgi:arabinose-5-phosphate isomerase
MTKKTPETPAEPHDFRALGMAVIRNEAASVAALAERIDDAFDQACLFMMQCQGRVVVTGMGKSGHIGNKIAATLASTGTPAFFVHPGEASHGDLGMIADKDVVMALSNSGETAEILTIMPIIKRLGVPLIALTGNANSNLATEADVHLDVSVEQEACPLGLAPTSSTTAALAMGDALAIALLEARGFTEEDFARSHPGGSLGRRLLLHVGDIMHTGEAVPKVSQDASLNQALLEMTRKGLGMTAVVDDEDHIIGIYTDGDLRRSLDQGVDVRHCAVADVMTPGCITLTPDSLAAEAVQLMESKKINSLLVANEQQELIGALNMHVLLQAGVM